MVRIQPFESKITPEPTPGAPAIGSVPDPWVSILTTAGPTLAAASMIADDSSMVTGSWEPVCCTPATEDAGAGRSKAPAWSSTNTVPPDARTADRAETVTIVAIPVPPRRPLFSGWVPVTGAGGAQAGDAGAAGSPVPGPPQAPAAAVAPVV